MPCSGGVARIGPARSTGRAGRAAWPRSRGRFGVPARTHLRRRHVGLQPGLYDASTVTSNKALALTPACAEVIVAHLDDIEEWVADGKPGF